MNEVLWDVFGSGTTTGRTLANPFSEKCASRNLLDHITSKWGILILVALSERTFRWGELRDHIGGISEKMLAQTLRTLESDGLIVRNSHGTVPPRVDYSLSMAGNELSELLIPLARWTADYASAPTTDN